MNQIRGERSKPLWLALWIAVFPTFCRAQNKSVTLPPIAEAPSIAKRALIIGVSGYEHANLVPEAAADARAMAELLNTRFGFSDDSIILMTDDPTTPERLKPTYTHLRSAFKTLLNGIQQKSEVVVFFAGHGIRRNNQDWLVPHDGLPDDVEATCINYDQFKQALRTKRPGRTLLMVDAGRNASGGTGALSGGFGTTKDPMWPQIAEFLSCQPTEVSHVGRPDDFAGSVFTHFLLQGLQAAPEAATARGLVTFDSLKLFVRSKVSRYVASRYSESQNPVGRAMPGTMALVRTSPPSKPNPQAVTGAKPGNDRNGDAHSTGADGDSIPLERIRTLKNGAELEYIPAGPFQMGDADRPDNPRHTVTLSGYYIYKNLVTVQQYLAFCDATGHPKPSAPDFNPNWNKRDHPIVDVNWVDAMAYCAWLSKETGYQVTLPTEAQWEKAARGPYGRKFPWGDTFDSSKLWCSQNKPGDAGGTTAVGHYGISLSSGCTDMAGNVVQWCLDWYDADFWSSRAAEGSDPQNQTVGYRTERVWRGGPWTANDPISFHCATRGRGDHGYLSGTIGFRCVVLPRPHSAQ